jgi:hypothetical protein
MEQPVTLHWQSKEAYFTAVLSPDLFGSWVLVTAGGKRDGRAGRVQHKPMPSYANGLENLNRLRKKRRSEGYALCATGFMALDDLDPQSPTSRNAETSAVLRAFSNLAIPLAQQAVLLGVEEAVINAYLDGNTLDNTPKLLERVQLIMAIHKALHLLLAGDPGRARAWLCSQNARFEQARPIDLMLASLDGLKIVRAYLEGEVDAMFREPPAVGLPRDRSCTGSMPA